MKILNLYCGIGGNRKNWGDKHEITAVEYNPDIAKIYQDFFPEDKVIVGDAHEYLINNFKDFDFIWSSPPCQSHSRLNRFKYFKGRKHQLEYPDMRLYQEILLLKHWFKGKYVVENVIPYYTPLIAGQLQGRHIFWANFQIKYFIPSKKKKNHPESYENYLQEFLGFDLSQYKIGNKLQILRNCVLPELGKHILDCVEEPERILDGRLF